MSELNQYQQQTANWRKSIKDNERRTFFVISAFVFFYVLVGFLLDVSIGTSYYNASAESVFTALITFRVVPYGTIIMLVVAWISLLIMYSMYDKIMLLGTEYFEITPKSARNSQEQQLYNVVEEMKVAAGLQYMPKVFIINAEYMNAFASGYSERSAMVAITRGLLEKLDRAEIQAVMAHELSHIRHHDIKLTLAVTLLSNIMLIIIDMLFYNLLFRDRRNENNRSGGSQGLFLIVMLLRYVLPLITLSLTLFLSRTREYMADAGAVELMRDNEPLARALMKITHDHRDNAGYYIDAYGHTSHEQVRQSSYIYDPSKIDPVSSLTSMFSTHPVLEDRLKAIGFTKKA